MPLLPKNSDFTIKSGQTFLWEDVTNRTVIMDRHDEKQYCHRACPSCLSGLLTNRTGTMAYPNLTQKSFLRCPEGCLPLHEAFLPGSLEKPGNFVPLCQVRHRPGTLLRQERHVRVQQGGPVGQGSAEKVRVHLPELESPAERV